MEQVLFNSLSLQELLTLYELANVTVCINDGKIITLILEN